MWLGFASQRKRFYIFSRHSFYFDLKSRFESLLSGSCSWSCLLIRMASSAKVEKKRWVKGTSTQTMMIYMKKYDVPEMDRLSFLSLRFPFCSLLVINFASIPALADVFLSVNMTEWGLLHKCCNDLSVIQKRDSSSAAHVMCSCPLFRVEEKMEKKGWGERAHTDPREEMIKRSSDCVCMCM